MKKKLIILIIFIALLPLAFMSGKSSWIILDEVDKEIDNTYYPVAVAPTFNEVYDGNYKEITVEDCSSATVKYDPSLLLIEYYDSANKKIGNKRANKPVNAGVYYAKTYYNSKLIGTTEMVIQEYPIYVVPNSYEISFGDATSSIEPGYRLCDLASGSYVERELFTNVEAGTRDTLNLIKGESFNYTYTYKQYANVGSYEIGIDIINESLLNPNYSVTVGTSSKLNVSKRALGFSWNQLEYTYDGTIHTPSITISNNLAEPHALKPIINGNVLKDAGTYPVTLQKEYDNFILNGEDADFSRNVVINKRNVLKGGASWSNTALTYNGKPQAPTITFDNIVAGEAVAPVYEYYSGATKLAGMPTNAGSYIVKLTGISGADSKNYTFTPLEQSFTIERAMPNKPEVATLQAKVGDLLSSVKLPEGFSLRGYQPTDKFTSEGRQNINVIYNPDSNNYKDLNTTLVVDVIKADAKVISVAIESATITYDGKPHKLSYTLKLNGEPIGALPAGVTLTIWFSDTATDCTNAGVYMVKRISLVGEGYELDGASKAEATKASLTINPLEIAVDGDISLNYEAGVRTWAQMQPKLAASMKFINKEGQVVVVPSSAYTVLGIHNGVYSYGNALKALDSSLTNVIGSVYQANLKLNTNNYKLTKSTFTFIYRTVKAENVFCTIEEAILNKTGLIRIEGNATNSTSYVGACFTKLTADEGNPYLSNGQAITTFKLANRTLLVPYKDGSNADCEKGGALGSNVYSLLVIPANIKLEFSGSWFNIGASISTCTKINQRGVVINEGNIIMHSGSHLNSYGYLKGKNGQILLESGSEAVDCMRVNDWPGGFAASICVSACFPLNSWSLHNISCTTRINSGAFYKAQAYIETGVANADTQVMVLGNQSSKECLFKPTSSNGFVVKKAIPARSWKDVTSADYQALYTITGDNQKIGQKDIIEINGNFVDGNLTVSAKGINVSTDTKKPAPLSYIDVVIKDGSDLLLSHSDYLFFPGTRATIENGASLTIGADVDLCMADMATINVAQYKNGPRSFTANCIDTTDAELVVNGEFISNGNFGGRIVTEVEGALLNLSNSNVAAQFKSLYNISKSAGLGDKNCYTATVGAKANVDNVPNTNISKGAYISSGTGDSAYFTSAKNQDDYILEFYDETGKVLDKAITITVINKPSYSVNGSEYLPVKKYYDFIRWVDLNGNEIENIPQSPGKPIKMKPIFELHVFNFSYLSGYGNKPNSEDVMYVDATYSNLMPTFTIDTIISSNNHLNITTTATYLDKYFDGWYFGIDKSNGIKVDYINQEMLDRIIEDAPGISSIPLFCDFTDEARFNVGFIGFNPNHENDTKFPSLSVIAGETITLPNPTKYDLDINEMYFFDGWYYEENGTPIRYTSDTLTVNKDWNLVARWTKKHELRLMTGTQLNINMGVTTQFDVYKTFYFMSGQTITLDLPKVGDDIIPIEQGHTFVGWDDTKIIDGTPKYDKMSSTNITMTMGSADKELYAAYNVNSYKVNVDAGKAILEISVTNNQTIKYGTKITFVLQWSYKISNYLYRAKIVDSQGVEIARYQGDHNDITTHKYTLNVDSNIKFIGFTE